jgi:DNA-binding beta-propeller fold protein YncE
MNSCWQFLGLITVGLLGLATAPSCAAEEAYDLVKEIPMPGTGAWDGLCVDGAGRRLYITHAPRVMVVDVDKDQVVGEIAATAGLRDFTIAPELGLGFFNSEAENKAGIVDLKTLQMKAKVSTGGAPWAILYEPRRQEVYVFNAGEKTATVFEAKTGKVVATILLPGRPQFAAADSKAARVFCTLSDENAVASIESLGHQVVETWPTAPGTDLASLTVDPLHHRLFLGCRNRMLLMMSCTNGKIVSTLNLTGSVDGLAFDPGTQLVFAYSGEEGTVTIAHEDSPETLAKRQTLKTERGAWTLAVDPKTHKLYLPTAKFHPTLDPKPRPDVIPGTFKVLVYGPGQ